MSEQKCFEVAILGEKVDQLENRCNKKDIKIEALQQLTPQVAELMKLPAKVEGLTAFQNKIIGWSMAGSGALTVAIEYFKR
jgi:hypothetical protein